MHTGTSRIDEAGYCNFVALKNLSPTIIRRREEHLAAEIEEFLYRHPPSSM